MLQKFHGEKKPLSSDHLGFRGGGSYGRDLRSSRESRAACYRRLVNPEGS